MSKRSFFQNRTEAEKKKLKRIKVANISELIDLHGNSNDSDYYDWSIE